ncbi:MAG TPA: competence/damage-inducible protein A [Acidimicrobiales bacterium]|nr:competence/damage-inducible protein A [Acidimicrobiales bacterium]
MRCEVVAVGTELLLGQIVNSNAAWIGEQLALRGIDHLRQTVVGDNHDRIVAVLRESLERAEAVIVCGGLGPTQDDITREAIAEVMGVPLGRDESLIGAMREVFERRGRSMPDSNLRQADLPEGATPIEQRTGTAPGLICPVGERVVYAVPGVPYEMREMLERAVLPDLEARAGVRAVYVSRTLRTWGESESRLAELLAPRVEALDATGNPTLAFLASGIEGLKVRLTARAATASEAAELLDAEEAEVRAVLGDLVFSGDDEPMEAVVGRQLEERGLTLAVAESLTGGLVASRLVAVAGASGWFRGAVVAYAGEVKRDLLGVPEGPVVSEAAAMAMADGVRRRLGADVGLATTGVAGPTEQEGQPVGTVWLGMALGDVVDAVQLRLPGDRDRIRQMAVISLLDRLRRHLTRQG